MSAIIANTSSFNGIVSAADMRDPVLFGLDTWFGLWPRSRGLGQGFTADVPRPEFVWFQWGSARGWGGVRWGGVRWGGVHAHKTIAGTTKDSAGTALAGATVKAYRTSADAANSLIADAQEGPAITSEADGGYVVVVPNADQHYLVAYKAGATDVAGTTKNNLVGA